MKTTLIILFLFTFNFCFSQTDQKIKNDSLPALVKQQFIKEFNGYTIIYAVKTIDVNKKILYKIDAQKKTRLLVLTYDTLGELITKQKSRIYTFDGTEKQSRPSNQSNDGHNHTH